MKLLKFILFLPVLILLTGCPIGSPSPSLGIINIEGGSNATTENILIFTVSIRNTSDGPFQYLWDFGDGNSSTSEKPGYKYSNPGEFAVNVKVTNSGGTSEQTSKVRISEPAASIYFWTQTPFNGNVRVDLNNTSSFISTYYTQFPGCIRNQGNAEFRGLRYGTYQYLAVSQSGKTWSGTISLNKPCNSLLLN